jgi:outer membrane protein assembly factor BamB
VLSSPAVAGSLVYVGSLGGRLYALDLRTGEARWDLDLGAPVHASPAVASGRLYLGTADGTVYAVEGTR